MRSRYLSLVLLLSCTLPSFGQEVGGGGLKAGGGGGGGSGVQSGAVNPSGSCTTGALYVQTTTNHLWACTSPNTWTDAGPSAASGAGGAPGQVQINIGGVLSGDTDLTFLTDTTTATKLCVAGILDAANSICLGTTANTIIFEGTTADANELTITAGDPTADVTWNLNAGATGLTLNLGSGSFTFAKPTIHQGVLTALDGSFAAPAYSFTNDSDSGLLNLAGIMSLSLNNQAIHIDLNPTHLDIAGLVAAPTTSFWNGISANVSGVTGGFLTIAGGSGTVGNANGGDLTLSGGAKSGSGIGGLLKFLDSTDLTKTASWVMSGITTATTRTFTLPNKNGTLAMISDLPGPGGSITQVQFHDTGDVFGGDAGLTYDKATDTLTAGAYVANASGAGYTEYTTGAMGVSLAGTVRCGANTGDVFSCSDNAGAVTPLPFLAGDLGGTQTSPQVNKLTLTGEGQLGTQALTTAVANEGGTGTTAKLLVKLTGAPSTAIKSGTSDTSKLVGVCVANCTTSGSARIATVGQATCTFDGATTAGNYVQASVTTAGQCHDAGATYPSTLQTLGRVLETIGGTGDANIVLFGPEITRPAATDVQIFTSTGGNTWTKPANALNVTVVLVGAGGGGSTGRRGAAGSQRGGGGAGGAGGYTRLVNVPASLLGATETCTVGLGGTGSSANAVDNTDGSAGVSGTATTFGIWGRAGGGSGSANGGTAAAGGTGGTGGTAEISGGTGGVGGAVGAGAAGSAGGGSFNATPGGGGGGISVGDGVANGGAGGDAGTATRGTALTGGTAGSACSAGGNGTSVSANESRGGAGAGGGASCITGASGAGGNGGIYGAGGGGGGASLNGNSGGKGGDGANGLCVVITTR